jgi:hypothetical protein
MKNGATLEYTVKKSPQIKILNTTYKFSHSARSLQYVGPGKDIFRS